jgi:hypothetical protein
MTPDAKQQQQQPRDNDGEVSTFALDVYWAQGRSGDATLDAHVAGCERCSAYLASLDGLAQSSVLPALPARSAKRDGVVRLAWALPAVSSLALAAGLALYLHARPRPGDGYVGIKGTPAVQLLLHRDRDTHLWDGHSPLHPGDALALRVACEGLKRVVVATPGESGWSPLSSTACPAGDDPLPFTLQVDSEPGDEKLAVVLSQDELDLDTLQKAIAETRRTADVWVSSFVMPKETSR